MDAVVALEQQRAALSDSVVQARRKLRRAKAAAKACARVWQPTATQRHTALITYAMTGYQAEPSVRYLEMLARGRHWPARDSAELHALVEEWFLAVGVDELAALSDVATPSDVAAMREAAPIVEEWRLAWWDAGKIWRGAWRQARQTCLTASRLRGCVQGTQTLTREGRLPCLCRGSGPRDSGGGGEPVTVRCQS